MRLDEMLGMSDSLVLRLSLEIMVRATTHIASTGRRLIVLGIPESMWESVRKIKKKNGILLAPMADYWPYVDGDT